MGRVGLLVALGLSGCGGESSNAPPGAAGAANGVAGSSAVDDPTGGGAAGKSSGDAGKAGAGAATGGGASGGNAGGEGGAGLVPLVPLVEGHTSLFTVAPLDAALPVMNACDAPHAKVGGTIAFDGHVGTSYESPCAPAPYLIEGTGDQLTAYIDESGQLRSYEYIHSPVEEGSSWTVSGALQTWHRAAEPFETPAGSFSDCWIRDADPYRYTYCRGFGLVHLWDSESNYELKLTSKNF